MTHSIKLGARLRAARKAAGFKTSREFIKRHKVPASTYSQHESGARSPDEEMIFFYGKTFAVNPEWLKDGRGQPFNRPTIEQKKAVHEELLDITEQKNAHQLKFGMINPAILEEIIKSLQSTKIKYTAASLAKDTASIYNQVINQQSNVTSQIKAVKTTLRKIIKQHKSITKFSNKIQTSESLSSIFT